MSGEGFAPHPKYIFSMYVSSWCEARYVACEYPLSCYCSFFSKHMMLPDCCDVFMPTFSRRAYF